MKPAWDQLSDAWKDSTSVLIADVDCTSEGGRAVCEENGVQGYPTIKYFTAEGGKTGADYSSGRDFASLNRFVEDELLKECEPKSKDACTEKEIAYIDKMSGVSRDKLSAEADRLVGLSRKPAADDKRVWVSQRLAILEQLLGRRGRRSKKMSLLAKVAIFLACIGAVVLMNVGLLRRWNRKSQEKEEAEKEANGESAKKSKDESEKLD
mmetsp:Transcript_55120/g.124062  ORF Transcript_55120/g.124062 Transcript_55120/m.124062 type:complete len:209 (+) Transcript_55120:220-846(+)